MRIALYIIIAAVLTSCGTKSTNNSSNTSLSTVDKASTAGLLDKLAEQAILHLDQVPYDTLAIPRTVEDGKMIGQPSKNWTSGFYPAMLWKLYGHSKDDRLKQAAEKWSAVVEKEKNDDGTHDLGFKIYCPFGSAYEITGDEAYRDIFLTAAKTLSTRYNATVGAIRSWDHHKHLWDYPVIIDNMMNLEMLFEATRLTGDSTFYHIANTHASTTLANHFRPDNSSYHVVSYDTITGKAMLKNTHQGLSHESDWSRGQAWGLHGYTSVYRYTKDPKYLEQAQKIADFIFTHPNLPKDKIPYWDYDAPNIPNEPRDVSAAAITASGLLELAVHDPANANKYNSWADEILTSLQSDTYKCDIAPFFLKHSVGSIPGEFEMDSPIIYADYFYVEALLRKQNLKN